MKNYFVNYRQALALNEIGFDEKCFGYYNSDKELRPVDTDFINFREVSEPSLKAPLKSQVFEWFRNVHQLFGEIHTDCTTEPKFCYAVNRFIGNPENLSEREWKWEDGLYSVLYRSRGRAESELIDYLIDIVKYK